MCMQTAEHAPGFERLGTLRQPSGRAAPPVGVGAAATAAAAVDEAFTEAAAAETAAAEAPSAAGAEVESETPAAAAGLSAGRFDGDSPSPLADTKRATKRIEREVKG